MTLRTLFIAAFAATALAAHAGEDSTERSGISGVGPAFYEANCSLAEFTGQDPYPAQEGPCRPVTAAVGGTAQPQPQPEQKTEPKKPGRERFE
jgi:hypothetical protein